MLILSIYSPAKKKSRTHTSTISTAHAKLGQPRIVPVPCTTMDTCSTPTDGSGARQGQHAKAKPVARPDTLLRIGAALGVRPMRPRARAAADGRYFADMLRPRARARVVWLCLCCADVSTRFNPRTNRSLLRFLILRFEPKKKKKVQGFKKKSTKCPVAYRWCQSKQAEQANPKPWSGENASELNSRRLGKEDQTSAGRRQKKKGKRGVAARSGRAPPLSLLTRFSSVLFSYHIRRPTGSSFSRSVHSVAWFQIPVGYLNLRAVTRSHRARPHGFVRRSASRGVPVRFQRLRLGHSPRSHPQFGSKRFELRSQCLPFPPYLNARLGRGTGPRADRRVGPGIEGRRRTPLGSERRCPGMDDHGQWMGPVRFGLVKPAALRDPPAACSERSR
jgi:hypothetical protein